MWVGCSPQAQAAQGPSMTLLWLSPVHSWNHNSPQNMSSSCLQRFGVQTPATQGGTIGKVKWACENPTGEGNPPYQGVEVWAASSGSYQENHMCSKCTGTSSSPWKKNWKVPVEKMLARGIQQKLVGEFLPTSKPPCKLCKLVIFLCKSMKERAAEVQAASASPAQSPASVLLTCHLPQLTQHTGKCRKMDFYQCPRCG